MSFAAEQAALRPLGVLPQPFDVVRRVRVARDATLRFEGRTDSVPFVYLEREVEVRGCARPIEVCADAQRIAEHARHTRERIAIDPAHYEGPGDERVAAPVPLGRMAQKIAEIAVQAPQRRSIDWYAALTEMAR